jgi:predicted ArsR family transcriptional regulator
LRVITEVGAGRWSVEEATRALGLSPRHVRRLRKRLAEEGARAFMHGNRGRPSPHRLGEDVRARVVELGAGRYAARTQSKPDARPRHDGFPFSTTVASI